MGLPEGLLQNQVRRISHKHKHYLHRLNMSRNKEPFFKPPLQAWHSLWSLCKNGSFLRWCYVVDLCGNSSPASVAFPRPFYATLLTLRLPPIIHCTTSKQLWVVVMQILHSSPAVSRRCANENQFCFKKKKVNFSWDSLFNASQEPQHEPSRFF